MNSLRPRVSALLLTLFTLSACDLITVSNDGFKTARLAPCSKEETPFASIPFADWPRTYHGTVSSIIEAHLRELGKTGTLELRCTEEDYGKLLKPTDELRGLATTLAPWKTSTGQSDLSEANLGPVLLEYLRDYECALSERDNFLSVIVPREHSSTDSMERGAYNTEKGKQEELIARERAVARPALERTLIIIGGLDRLRPLGVDVECLKRTSLDIRNSLGLVSQAVSCLARLRDTQGSLRDPPQAP